MSKPNYRVNVTFDGERKLFMARAPELDHCSAEGATRAEAIARLEEEIDAQLANMLSHGSTPPRSVDEETFSGEISAKISKGLHKEIAYQARSEGVELELLVAELLAAATESRKATRAPRSGNRAAPVDHDNIGNRAPADFNRGGDGNRGGGPRGFGRGGNSAVMDDRATFIEYVRGLEQQGGHAGHRGHQGGGSGGGGGGPHGGGGPGGDGRRRRRGGRGGQGGNPNFRGGPNGGHNDRHFSGGGGGNGGPRPGNGSPNGNGAPQPGGHAEAPHNAAPQSEAPRGPGGDDSGNA